MTELLFRDDAYARECEANVVAINDRGGILLDRTVFYALSGGQAGDKGVLRTSAGVEVPIALAVFDENKDVVHVPASGEGVPQQGEQVTVALDW